MSRPPACHTRKAAKFSRRWLSLSGDLTLLFIEHDMHVVFRFATHIIVLVGGSVFAEGSPAEIAADPGVREVYLGTRQHG